MAVKSLDRVLAELEESRYRFGRGQEAQVATLLRVFDKIRFRDASSLIRLHEALLFLRAFPQGPGVVRKTEKLLNTFWERVAELRQCRVDLRSWDTFESSGVAGTAMEDTLSFDIARWLLERMPNKLEIAWDNYESGRELGATWPRFMPLLEDDAYVEADTPWRQWLEGAQGKKNASPQWLIRRFEGLALSEHDKTELYDSLRLPLRWDLGNSRVSRTRNWERVRNIFYHTGPLISRSQVSLAEELAKKPPALVKLSRKQGERVIDVIRTAANAVQEATAAA